jgi:hypothetical protein
VTALNFFASRAGHTSLALRDGAQGKVFMPYLFLAALAVAIAAFAPLKITASLFLSIALVITVVKLTASKIAEPVSFGAAAQAVAWSCVLPALTLLAMLIQFKGVVRFEGVTGAVLLSVLFASFALGFKLSLNTTFNASARIAVVSTVVAGGLLFLLQPLLF